ncbi:MAG: HAD family hydrolase [Armatimonadetes bacterium]|nr:HAD family hydrolase [Armatimonadota bacterium]
MRTNDFAGWMALQRPFPGVAEQMRRIREQALGVAVATTKDAHSAERLLETVGVENVQVYGREVSLDKADHMRAISTQFKVPTSRIVFVEDLLENLLPLMPMGVLPVLADWGYNTAAERARAESLGVTVASVPTLANRVLTCSRDR